MLLKTQKPFWLDSFVKTTLTRETRNVTVSVHFSDKEKDESGSLQSDRRQRVIGDHAGLRTAKLQPCHLQPLNTWNCCLYSLCFVCKVLPCSLRSEGFFAFVMMALLRLDWLQRVQLLTSSGKTRFSPAEPTKLPQASSHTLVSLCGFLQRNISLRYSAAR